MRVVQFLDARGGGFRQGLGAGAFLARRRQRRVGGLGSACRLRPAPLSACWRGVGGLVARRFGRGDGIQQRVALARRSARAPASASRSSRASSSLAAVQFGDMRVRGVGWRVLPARAVVGDGAQARACGLSPSRRRPSSAARASLACGAGLGGLFRARRPHCWISAAPSPSSAERRSRPGCCDFERCVDATG